MRFLANENFPLLAVEELRSCGHDVSWVRVVQPGATDREVLERANEEKRVLVTFDKDFGELAFRERALASSGIILFRISMNSPKAVANLVVKAISSRSNWAGHFSVVQETRIRMLPLS